MGAFPYPAGFAGTKRVQQYVDYFQKQGLPVAVLSLMGRAGLPGNELVAGLHNGVPYRVIGRDLKAGLRLPTALVKYLHDGCRYLHDRRDAGSVNILFHYGQPAGENILFLLYARKLGYRIVHDLVEDYDLLEGCRRSFLFNMKIWLMKKLSRTIPRLSDGLVVISRHLEQKYTGCGVPMVRIPIAADAPEPVPEKPRNSPVRIVYAGTFAPKDGIHILLEAYQQVRKDYPGCILCLAGGRESPLSRFPAELIRGVEYAGYLSNEEFRRFLQDADILCMTRMNSAFANAGFPFKLGEYLATGSPVVASRVSNLDEYLTDKHDVMLVDPENVQQLSDALLYLLRNPERARQIGANGFAACVQHFNPEANGNRLWHFLKDMVNWEE
jgi:glycosyltransferase involved in cell wall biosynthesis